MGETKEAVYSYLEAMAYHDKVERLGVDLTYPRYITDDYEDVKAAYIKELYNESNELMADKKFNQATMPAQGNRAVGNQSYKKMCRN